MKLCRRHQGDGDIYAESTCEACQETKAALLGSSTNERKKKPRGYSQKAMLEDALSAHIAGLQKTLKLVQSLEEDKL